MSMAVKTSKVYKHLSGLLSIAIPAKAFRSRTVQNDRRWGKLQVKKPSFSVWQILNGASVNHSAERERRNLRVVVETWGFGLLMSQEGTFVKYNSYWHFCNLCFFCLQWLSLFSVCGSGRLLDKHKVNAQNFLFLVFCSYRVKINSTSSKSSLSVELALLVTSSKCCLLCFL